MKKEKGVTSKVELQAYFNESVGLERELLVEIQKSKRTAWRVASVAMGAGLLGLLMGYLGMSQDAPDPTVLRVDNTTGAVERVSIIREETSYGEAVDSYFLNQYVLARESYEYYGIQRMFDTTRLMSSAEAWKSYEAKYTGNDALDKVLNTRAEDVVRVRSITPNVDNGTATIRYTTQRKYANGSSDPVKHMIATVTYNYVRAWMTEEERRINPLGFVVTSFRADPEVVAN